MAGSFDAKLKNNTLVKAMILLALVIRIIIPNGFMLGNAQNIAKGTPIVLCTAQGNIDAYMGKDGSIETKASLEKKSHSSNNDKTHADCAFAFATHHVPIVNLFYTPAFFTNYVVTQKISENTPMIGKGLAAPPPPKTGPPSII